MARTCCRTIADNLPAEVTLFDLEADLSDKRFPEKFLKSVNALLNSKGGNIIIHAENVNHLNMLDQKIDPHLKDLLPENLFYHDVFSRYIEDDGKHVVYLVDCSSRNILLSIHTPFTRVSLNRGVVKPSQSEVMRLVGRAWSRAGLQGKGREEQKAELSDAGHDDKEHMETTSDDVYDRRNWFMQGLVKENKIKHENIPFTEDLRIQAKHRVEEHLTDDDSVEGLVGHLWDKWDLPHYISAFSSVPKGGSFYFDIKEDKSKRDYEGGTIQLTAFVCKGINLNEAEGDQLKEQIKKKLSNIVCIGSERPENQVQIELHQVQREQQDARYMDPGRQTYVVEIRVAEYKHGAVFYRQGGPLIYAVQKPQNQEAVELTLDEVIKVMDNWCRENNKEFYCQLQHFRFEPQAHQSTASATSEESSMAVDDPHAGDD